MIKVPRCKQTILNLHRREHRWSLMRLQCRRYPGRWLPTSDKSRRFMRTHIFSTSVNEMRAQYGTRLATLKTTSYKDGQFLIIILSKLK